MFACHLGQVPNRARADVRDDFGSCKAPCAQRRREVPLPRFLVEQLSPHLATLKPDDLVFTGVRRGSPLRAAIFRRGHFNAAAEAIGLPGLHPHELRHSAASLLLNERGRNLRELQDLLGHRSLSTTARCTHIDRGRLRSVVDDLGLA